MKMPTMVSIVSQRKSYNKIAAEKAFEKTIKFLKDLK